MPKDKATTYDMATNGLRIFRFEHTMAASLEEVIATVELFEPLAT